MNKIKKSNRSKTSMSDFISSPFSPVMADTLDAARSAGESASLTLDKRVFGKQPS